MTIETLYNHLKSGKTVYWSNTRYKVYSTDIVYPPESEVGKYQRNHFSYRDGKLLSIRCIENYFGDLVNESDLSDLFIL